MVLTWVLRSIINRWVVSSNIGKRMDKQNSLKPWDNTKQSKKDEPKKELQMCTRCCDFVLCMWAWCCRCGTLCKVVLAKRKNHHFLQPQGFYCTMRIHKDGDESFANHWNSRGLPKKLLGNELKFREIIVSLVFLVCRTHPRVCLRFKGMGEIQWKVRGDGRSNRHSGREGWWDSWLFERKKCGGSFRFIATHCNCKPVQGHRFLPCTVLLEDASMGWGCCWHQETKYIA